MTNFCSGKREMMDRLILRKNKLGPKGLRELYNTVSEVGGFEKSFNKEMNDDMINSFIDNRPARNAMDTSVVPNTYFDYRLATLMMPSRGKTARGATLCSPGKAIEQGRFWTAPLTTCPLKRIVIMVFWVKGQTPLLLWLMLLYRLI